MDGGQVTGQESGGTLGKAYEDLVGELKRDLDGKQSTALLNEDVSTFGVPDPRILICGCATFGVHFEQPQVEQNDLRLCWPRV